MRGVTGGGRWRRGGVRSCCVEGAGGWKISRPYGVVGVGHLPSSRALTHARTPPPPFPVRHAERGTFPHKQRRSDLIAFSCAENYIGRSSRGMRVSEFSVEKTKQNTNMTSIALRGTFVL